MIMDATFQAYRYITTGPYTMGTPQFPIICKAGTPAETAAYQNQSKLANIQWIAHNTGMNTVWWVPDKDITPLIGVQAINFKINAVGNCIPFDMITESACYTQDQQCIRKACRKVLAIDGMALQQVGIFAPGDWELEDSIGPFGDPSQL